MLQKEPNSLVQGNPAPLVKKGNPEALQRFCKAENTRVVAKMGQKYICY